MKTTVSLFLFVTILLLGSGCKTTNLATEKVSHEQAIQALEQHSFKIVIEEIYDKSTSRRRPKQRFASDCYFSMQGNEVSYYISPEDIGSRTKRSPRHECGLTATLSKGEKQKNGDIHYELKTNGEATRVSTMLIILYKDTNRCFVRLTKSFLGSNYNFTGHVLPL